MIVIISFALSYNKKCSSTLNFRSLSRTSFVLSLSAFLILTDWFWSDSGLLYPYIWIKCLQVYPKTNASCFTHQQCTLFKTCWESHVNNDYFNYVISKQRYSWGTNGGPNGCHWQRKLCRPMESGFRCIHIWHAHLHRGRGQISL